MKNLRKMNSYLSDINQKQKPEIINDILSQAKTLNTPIVTDCAINLIIQFIKVANANSVLEIGTAIGYSAIMMALSTNAKITSIEKERRAYEIALANIEKAKLESMINLIYGDALETDIDLEFDLIFIDAAKGKYQDFFSKYKKLLKKNGIIICDNLLLHGVIEHPELVKTRRKRQLVNKIDKFNHWLTKQEDFDTYIYEIGDGLSVSIKK